jgi:hypothetical protein
MLMDGAHATEILPYDDPIVCIELDGKGIRDTIEHALSKWPAQEG